MLDLGDRLLQRMRPWLHSVCIALASGVLALSAAPPAPRHAQPRFVFLIETSLPLAGHKAELAQAVATQIESGLEGQMRPGDAFAFWTFDSVLTTNRYPLMTWAPTPGPIIVQELLRAFESLPFAGDARLDPVLQQVIRTTGDLEPVTIVVFRGAPHPVVGTPFDDKINRTLQHAKEQRTSLGPVHVARFLARKGKLMAWSLHTASGQALAVPAMADGLSNAAPPPKLPPPEAAPRKLVQADSRPIAPKAQPEPATISSAPPVAQTVHSEAAHPGAATAPATTIPSSKETQLDSGGDDGRRMAHEEPKAPVSTSPALADDPPVASQPSGAPHSEPATEESAPLPSLPLASQDPPGDSLSGAVEQATEPSSAAAGPPATGTQSEAAPQPAVAPPAPPSPATTPAPIAPEPLPVASGGESGLRFLALGLGLLVVAAAMLFYFARSRGGGVRTSLISQSLDPGKPPP